MNKYLCILVLFFCGVLGAESKVLKNPSFELLSGTWCEKENRWRRYTDTDKLDMARFGEDYEQKARLLFLRAPADQWRIPRVLHFIWIGPKPFPKESIANLKAWQKLHPDWTMKFWTDSKERPLPIKGMQRHLIDELHFSYLQPFLALTTNYGEKADIIRYEILYQQGGVYSDHDVMPYHTFDALNSTFDFYVGLENPHTNPGVGTKVFPCNCLFGARALHPILAKTIENVASRWHAVEERYPGLDPKESKNRVLNRTFHSFTLATKECFSQDGNVDILLPSSFFFAHKIFKKKTIAKLKKKGLVYARHDFASQWTSKEESSK